MIWSNSILVLNSACCFQNDTKPVKMMYQKTKFPLTYIPEGSCQVINSKLIYIISQLQWESVNNKPINLLPNQLVSMKPMRFWLWFRLLTRKLLLFPSFHVVFYDLILETCCSVAQILEMPYQGKELSMLIFLPMDIEDGSTGLEKVQ